MKLASLKSNRRNGELCVVSRDLTKAVNVIEIAIDLQTALDDWARCKPHLEQVYKKLNDNQCANAFVFDAKQVHSPLARSYQWADGSAYVNHVELVRKARGATMPENFWHDALMYQGGSDHFIGPCDDIHIASTDYGIDFEAEVAIITDDVPMGVSAEAASKHIQLILLVNDVSLRNLIPNEMAKGFGFFQSKPASAFSPVAVTPDELGKHWHENKLHLPLMVHYNNQLFGQANAGVDMTFDFATLIAHAAKTRHLSAGTIIGSGTVSNVDRRVGSSCIAEKRMLEIIESGHAKTAFMQFGDRVCIEMLDENKQSIFGAIDQQVVEYKPHD